MATHTKVQGVIYCHCNTINQKVYIGQTYREKQRKIEHLSHSKVKNSHFYNAIANYGYDSFSYSVLCRISSKSIQNLKVVLNSLERFFIKKYKSNNPNFGYNNTIGGDCAGPMGNIINIYDLQGNLLDSLYFREICSKYNLTAETVYNAIRNNHIARKQYYLRFQNNPYPIKKTYKSKNKYYQTELNGTIVRVWDSVMECKKSGYDSSQIIKCCNHPDIKKTYKGYKWYRVKT